MILNEKDYLGGLMQWTGNKMKSAKDRAMAVAGSEQAVGRLNMRAITDKLIASWKQFAGERKQAGVEGYDAYDPTMSQIEEFLAKRFGIEFNLSSDPEIAAAAEAAGVQQDDDQADDLKATTPNELEHLKRLATGDNVRAANPPGPAKRRVDPDPEIEARKQELRRKMTDESVELNEAGQGDALRRLFGVIALQLWDQGLASVDRGVGTDKNGNSRRGNYSINGKNAPKNSGDADSAGAASDTDVETRVDNNGTFLNARLMREGLIKHGVDGAMIHMLKKALKGGGPYEAFQRANDTQKQQMVAIAAVTVSSLQKAKAKMLAGENITRDGNTLNFNAFMETLKKYKVQDREIGMAMSSLKKANADGEIDQADVKALMDNGDDTGMAVLGIMAAAVAAIARVGKEPQADEKPAPAAEPEAEKKAEAE